MVQEPPSDPRTLSDLQGGDRLASLDEAQEVEHAVQRADLTLRRDHGRGVFPYPRGADQVTLVTQRCERLLQAQLCDRRGRGGRP